MATTGSFLTIDFCQSLLEGWVAWTLGGHRAQLHFRPWHSVGTYLPVGQGASESKAQGESFYFGSSLEYAGSWVCTCVGGSWGREGLGLALTPSIA